MIVDRLQIWINRCQVTNNAALNAFSAGGHWQAETNILIVKVEICMYTLIFDVFFIYNVLLLCHVQNDGC